MIDKSQEQIDQSEAAVSKETSDFDGWNYNSMSKHPGGVESAVQDNIARIERKTMDLIENGSIEEIARALEENTNQLRMLQEKMAEIARLMHAG
ncbi:MAG: hypothetical protein K2Z81_01110 [Cyanobacteria bacterium]|nr:hypothetical protein [Cyanobacteriota bacterium]